MAQAIQSVNIPRLEKIARELRVDVIRMLEAAGSGHPGGSFSEMEILVALYFHRLRHDPKNPAWEGRDRLILSKGHGCPGLYACLARAGYFPHEELASLRKIGSRLQGHPDRLRLPGIEVSTGSLGQGLSMAIGMALAAKLDGASWRTYCILGDGEIQEGQIWEAAMAAPKFNLDNLTVILDHNNGQIDGPVEEIMPLAPLPEKWKAFNWHVQCIDGHDFKEIFAALETADAVQGKPHAILAKTVKGKGVSFMEHQIEWHGKAPNREQAEKAVAELAGKPD
ncbi:MAG: transketolase [Elusimicrobia bacterium RIFCSPLOWO2_12_FULL_59_9]|nr:MAG: transketolase [Elusimicrobia bacterium RIFCSPLOWO2_12_FULL_59_9]